VCIKGRRVGLGLICCVKCRFQLLCFGVVVFVFLCFCVFMFLCFCVFVFVSL